MMENDNPNVAKDTLGTPTSEVHVDADASKEQVSEQCSAEAPVATSQNTTSDKTDMVSEPLPEAKPEAEKEASEQTVSSIPQTEPRTFGAALFDGLAFLGPILPILCIAACIIPWAHKHSVDAASQRLLDCTAAFANAPTSLFAWLQTGSPAADVSILSVWMMKGVEFLWQLLNIQALTGIELTGAVLIAGGALCSSVLAIIILWCSALTFTHNRRIALASCLLFATIIGVNLEMRSDVGGMLFVACTLASMAFMYSGYARTFAPVRLLLGGLFTALAFVAGGVFGIILPLATSILFLFWRGTFRRAGARDGAFGFGLMLVIVLGWALILFLTADGHSIMDSVLTYQASLWTPAWAVGIQPDVVLCILPWVLLLAFIPWSELKHIPHAFWSNRTENPGTGWIWLATVVSAALLVLAWPFAPYTGLVLGAVLSCILGKRLVNLTQGQSQALYGILGVSLLATALLFGVASIFDAILAWFPEMLKTLQPAFPYIAGISFVFGVIMVALKRISAKGGLLLATLVTITFSIAFAYSL